MGSVRLAVRGAACAVALATLTTRCRAQGPGWGGTLPFTNVFITVGNAFTNADRLNARFDSTRFDAIADHGFSLGAGVYFPYGRMLFGGEFHSADFGYESSAIGRTNKMTSRFWLVTFGYALVSTWNVTVFPYLGAGQGSTQLVLSDPAGGTPVASNRQPLFNDILTSPGSRSVIDGSYPLFQPGLGIDYLLLRTPQSHYGVTLGLRMGTSISPHRTTWRYQGWDVAGAPDAGPVSNFVRVLIGIGGFRFAP